MNEIEQKNAIIESASISTGDSGLLTSYLGLNYGSSGQGFGGFALYLPKSYTHHNPSALCAGHWLWRIMAIAGVDDWSQLKGKTVRVRATDSKVLAIGHIVNDDWFYPDEDFEAMKASKAA